MQRLSGVFLKMTRQMYLVVRLSAFVFLYLDTNIKSQRHSTCLSLRRCGCLRVSVCPSLPVCVCLCLSLCPSFSVCLCRPVGLSVSRTASLSVCRSVGPSVCLSPFVSVWCLSRKSVCLSVCLCLPSQVHSQPLNQKRRRHG